MTDTTTDRYPTRDEVFYGRGVWPMGDDGDWGLLAEGHGLRTLAAINAHERAMRGYGGWSRLDGFPGATEIWVTLFETCGCTAEQHAQHVADSKTAGLDWTDCDCERYGMPPCRDVYGWTTERVESGTPGALAMTEVTW